MGKQITANPIITKISRWITESGTTIGRISADTPSTNRMLNMMDPSTLPTTRSISRRSAAITHVASSGSDVPSATTVRLTTTIGMPSSIAIASVAATSSVAPPASTISPMATSIGPVHHRPDPPLFDSCCPSPLSIR